ncbi:arrestin domain-containing protein 17-like [Odontomachus brunneus]|uniref:arrestin domain-containing protein 17-like n=1 Tax=Odontomachus brunneus TaxID=486640 RepID=UPI0013F1B83C|nr:arrestin domain-containing protein 17-like [Odontomachus brunneus]
MSPPTFQCSTSGVGLLTQPVRTRGTDAESRRSVSHGMLPRLLPRIDATSSRSISDISTQSSRRMPSLRTFRVEFDRPGATYAPGEVVTGNVIVNLASEKTIRALKLTVKGEANVHWERRRTTKDSQGRQQTHTDHFRGNEQYFNLTYLLLGDTGGGEVRMPSGYSEYAFSFLLPHNIPCSFEHKHGHIRYTTKAIIDRPWKFNHECKVAFTVVTSYDLNAHSQQCIGIDDEENESFFCCFSRGSIKMCIKLPTTGFVPGQSIETTVNLENTSRVNIVRICVKLERSLEFHAKTPYHLTKTDKAIVKAEQNNGPFGQLSNIVSRLQIPPIPPSQLEHCGIIDQKYTVRITVHVSGMHCSITKTYPILIGTIPLRSTMPSAPYQQNIPQPTAPMIQEYDDPPPPMPTSLDYSPPNVPYPGSIGFVSPNQPSTSTSQWDMPPPSYEECMQKTSNIKDHDESNYVHGANEPFAPRYPVFNFPASYPPGN